uniref:C-type lectin domain-containing protein n=1 Tax=Oryzias sinensis TaxID=183150 RepID=A0A8C7XP76_9TELE
WGVTATSFPLLLWNLSGVAETGRHVLVDQQKSWLDAQAHCRSQHTDLSSIRSLAENAQVSAVLSATFRQFGLVQSNGRDDCVLMESSSSTWFWRPCTEYHPFLCNTGEPRAFKAGFCVCT